MKRKLIFMLGLCLMFVLSVWGCKKSENESEDAKQIVIWAWDETFNVKAAELAAVEYKKEHPGVEIIIEAKEKEEILSDTKNLLGAGSHSSLPDVMLIEDYDVQEVLALYSDEFVDLTDKISYDKYADYKTEVCSKDGRIYGIPFDSGSAALFYRLDIIEEAGFTEEDMQNLTWEKYIDIGIKVYERTGISMLTLDPTDLPQIRLMLQSCGKWYVKNDGKEVDIEDNEALLQSLQIYNRLLETGVGTSVNGWNEFISSFQNGRVASVVSGCWIISSIEANREQSGLWRVAPIPVMSENENAHNASNVGGSSWYILRNSNNSETATEFMVSMFSENDDFMDNLISEIGIIPAVKNSEIFDNYEAKSEFWGNQQITKIVAGFAGKIPAVNYGSNTYEIEDILEEELQYALVNGDLKQCLQRVQMKAETIVAN